MGVASGVDFGSFFNFLDFLIFRFLSLGTPPAVLKWLVELRNFQFAEFQAIPGGGELRHVELFKNLIPVFKKYQF